MRAADLTFDSTKPQRFRSLRSKVFLPFFALVIALFAAMIWGSIYLSERSFRNSADERLSAAQEVLYREFKKQETILQTYAVIMQQFQTISERFRNEGEIAILQDRLFITLDEADIDTAFYPADIRNLVQQESLVSLFDQVRRSQRLRFRYTSEFGGVPVLMVAAPILRKGQVTQVILLKTEMGDTFLRNVTSSLNVSASLMTIDGQVMSKSDPDAEDIMLTPAQLDQVGTGRPLFVDRESKAGPERFLFTIIPLGSSDMVLLALGASLKASTELQRETLLRMFLIMASAIVLCTIFYFKRISTITLPARELRNAAEIISRGNLNYRIQGITNDELGEIAVAFNQMASELEHSYQERASKDIENALARQEGKTKLLLEKKERERDRLNEELNIIQRESSALYQLNQAMTASIELNALFDRILQVLNETLACDHIVMLAHNLGESTLEVVRTAGLDAEALGKVRFNFNQGVTGEAAQTQRMIYVKNLDEDKRNLSYHGQVVTRGSLISVPLIVKGRLVGVINLHKKQIDAFTVSEQKLIQAVANQTAIAIDNAQLIEKMELNRRAWATSRLRIS